MILDPYNVRSKVEQITQNLQYFLNRRIIIYIDPLRFVLVPEYYHQ